jgi:hypothetical protein
MVQMASAELPLSKKYTTQLRCAQIPHSTAEGLIGVIISIFLVPCVQIMVLAFNIYVLDY